ncbi:MAG: M56 family metallopeptidase [Pedobacter sp.]|jgi:hypothetical protein
MEVLSLYLLKVHAGTSLLYAIYHLTAKNELFFRLNRFILLGILLISFSLPLLPSLNMHTINQANSGFVQTVFSKTDYSPDDLLKGKEVSKFADEIMIKRLSALIIILLTFYLVVVVILLLRFINQISNVLYFVKNSERVVENNIMYHDPGEETAAFSFFNSILINREQYDDEQFSQILAHEKAHVNQRHSIDILLAELACVFLWANPFAKALKNTIRLNLEFLADKEVLNKGFNKQKYQWSILRPYLKQYTYPLTNLYSSKPKQRIEKMNAQESPVFNLYKYALIIPMIAFIYFGIAPFHATALDKIYTMHLIEKHEFRDYLGYYEFENDKGSFINILMKDETLVMKTLWNNERIYFQKQSENGFINKEATIPLVFPRNWDGTVSGLVAFGNDRWRKVKQFKPVQKKAGEGAVLSLTASGSMQVLVYPVGPWEKVKKYTIKSTVSGP